MEKLFNIVQGKDLSSEQNLEISLEEDQKENSLSTADYAQQHASLSVVDPGNDPNLDEDPPPSK